MPVAIQLDAVSKRYRTGRSRTLVDLIASTVSGARGKSASVHSATRGTVDANIWATGRGPDEFRRRIVEEVPKWKNVIEKGRIKAQ